MFIECGISNSKILFLYGDKEETFEEKLERMKMDKFKKDYPMFNNLDKVIENIKTNIKIHSNEYMNN